MTLLSVRELAVHFPSERGPVRVVDGVSLDLEQGQTLGLVGESGSGKSLTSLAVMGLVPAPGRVAGGTVSFRGEDLLRASPARLRTLRGKHIAMVFQDPLSALNPLLTIGRQLTEVLAVHEGLGRREATRRAARALGEVGIPAPEERLARFPHQLSGGMRQRVTIAMALLCRPALVLADEPTTALDVTIQAQILELLATLRERHGTALVLITHDLGVVAGMADEVLVLYAGRVVERAPCRELFARPAHPYTAGLLASVPTLQSEHEAPLATIPGQPPDPAALPEGCAFAPRCALRASGCERERPALAPAPGRGPSAGHDTACFESARLCADPAGGRR